MTRLRRSRGVGLWLAAVMLAALPLGSAFASNAAQPYTLRMSDLPSGYVRTQASAMSVQAAAGQSASAKALLAHGYVAGYASVFAKGTSARRRSISSAAFLFRAASGARWIAGKLTRDLVRTGFRAVPAPRLADGSRGYQQVRELGSTRDIDYLIVVWGGPVLAYVQLQEPAGSAHFSAAVALARIIAARLKA